MLVVCAKRGVQRMTKEHLGIALALKLPIFVVITKIDTAPDHVRKNTVQRITRILKSPGVRKHPYKVRTMDSVFSCARNMQGGQDSLVPMFFVSNVDGTGLDYVRTFLNLLPMRNHWVGKQDHPAEFNIDEHFNISGVGTVVAGTMYSGQVSAGDELLMGPDPLGDFKKVIVKSIHTKQMPVVRCVSWRCISWRWAAYRRAVLHSVSLRCFALRLIAMIALSPPSELSELSAPLSHTRRRRRALQDKA